MTITTTKAVQVARFLRRMINNPARDLDRALTRSGLELPSQVKRLDRRGAASRVIERRRQVVTELLRREVAGC